MRTKKKPEPDWVFCDQNYNPEVIRCARCGEMVETFGGRKRMTIEMHTARLNGFTMMHSECKEGDAAALGR